MSAPLLRPAAALVAVALFAAALVAAPLTGAAQAAAPTHPTTSDPARVGLFGGQDPTYDGAYRQSLGLLATIAAGGVPDPTAVHWLLAQQCADGGFEAWRPKPSEPCTPPDSATFSGEDTNSTGIAAQALAALDRSAEAGRAVDWLAAHQRPDGGFAYYPDGATGNASDANSTALSLSGFLAAGRAAPHAGSGSGPTPYDALQAMQVGCAGAATDRGAFMFYGSANDFATVQATLAMAGGFLPVDALPGAADAPVLTCPVAVRAAGTPGPGTGASADVAAGYLARRLAANAHVIPDAFGTGTDYGTTANAVIALVASRHGSGEVAAALAALAGSVGPFVVKSGADQPGALATLVLAAHAGGVDPATFGGTDLVARLAATVTLPLAAPTPTPTSTHPSPSGTHAPASDPAAGGDTLPPTGVDRRLPSTALLSAALVGLGLALVGGSTYARRVRNQPGGATEGVDRTA